MTELVPHGYIPVHEAVNRLGRELFPEAWTGEEYEARSGLISEEEWLKITDLAPARGGGAPGSAPLRTPIAASAATAPHRTRVEVQAFQLAHDRFGEAAERPLLEFVGDSAHQEITGQPHGRRRPMQPPPLAAQFEDRRGGKLRQPLRDIDRRLGHVSDRTIHINERAAFRFGNGERRHWTSLM